MAAILNPHPGLVTFQKHAPRSFVIVLLSRPPPHPQGQLVPVETCLIYSNPPLFATNVIRAPGHTLEDN